ncbi:hypothetical protein BH11PSE11_BH11PSE11_17990 [soil metagenome]
MLLFLLGIPKAGPRSGLKENPTRLDDYGNTEKNLKIVSPAMFRSMIIASFVLALSPLDELVFPGLIPKSIADAVEGQPIPAIFDHLWLAAAIFLPWAIVSLAGIAGLLFFKRWARSVCLWTTALGFCLYPLLGTQVSSGLAAGLSEVSFTLWGAVLALAYCSPLSERFQGGQPQTA